jgi:biopolymer transport protein ExbD
MRFPRNARIFHSQLDAAPLASVFFLLVIFVLLGGMIYTPGVRMRIELPEGGAGLAGVDGPTIAVAVDAAGQFYFENQLIHESDLKMRLRAAAANSPQPVTLVVLGDKAMREETILQLASLASEAGIRDLALAARPAAAAAVGEPTGP